MGRGSTLNISLTPKLKKYIERRVKSGAYSSASELVRQSLMFMEKQEKADAKYWAEVRKKVAEAEKEIADGAGIPGEVAWSEIQKFMDEREHSRARRRRAG